MDNLIKKIINMKELDGCCCHTNPPCSFCISERNQTIDEVVELLKTTPKLYAIGNDDCFTDFDIEKDFRADNSSGEHSGGFIALANNQEQAREVLEKFKGSYGDPCKFQGTLKEIDITKVGVVFFGDGDC